MRDDLAVVDGASAGAWIKPRLGGKFGAVSRHVPKDYEAYARIFHPAFDVDWNPVRWAEVAEVLGTTTHREMQWHAICGPEKLRGSNEPDTSVELKRVSHDPLTGAMSIDDLDALCEVLAAQTDDPGHCYFGLCTILDWLHDFRPGELKPLLELPHGRDHVVLGGPLNAVDQIIRDWSKPSSGRAISVARVRGGPAHVDKAGREAPNLIWPANRTWLVASEVDFDSTLVGGSAHLIRTIVESPKLEAWQVELSDSLARDADKIN